VNIVIVWNSIKKQDGSPAIRYPSGHFPPRTEKKVLFGKAPEIQMAGLPVFGKIEVLRKKIKSPESFYCRETLM
jgi:hypothetical protein